MKKLFKNLKWLFKEAPTTLTEGPATPCSYCGRTIGGSWHYLEPNFTICHFCLKEMADKVLGNRQSPLVIM
jgi:ribosomal protein S14